MRRPGPISDGRSRPEPAASLPRNYKLGGAELGEGGGDSHELVEHRGRGFHHHLVLAITTISLGLSVIVEPETIESASAVDEGDVTDVLSPRTDRLVKGGGAFLAVAFVAFALRAATDLGGGGTASIFENWVYDLLLLGAAASCLLRAALFRRERLAWALLGLALTVWTAGEIYYETVLAGAASIPIPSPADAGYLLFYPIAYAGLIVLMRERIDSFTLARRLDALIVGAAVAALTAALALQPIVDASTSSGDTLAVATNLAYPICDVTLLALVTTAAALDGWRLGTRWLVLASGLIALAISDVLYLLQSAEGSYVEGGLLDALWPLGALLIAAAAWIAPPPARRGSTRLSTGLRQIIVPVAGALVAIGIQAADHFDAVPPLATALSLVTLLAVVARMALSFRENLSHLAVSTHLALTDSLTGLGNRRKLMADLEETTARAREPGEVSLMVVFDLDGFKAYNDAYGHPAGDALLRRLGSRLAEFTAGHGRAYRLGGDEFAVLAECTVAQVDGLVAGSTASLGEHGDGFVVTASQGNVIIPTEAADSEAALQLADRRMYANKSRERASAGTQSRDVLLVALREESPDLHEHLAGVAELVALVAEDLGLDAEERDEVRRAAELHDVGKMAIPDAILTKPGPLDPAEWEFIRKHTLIGERIIGAAPALVPVARLVRSSHERWDGGGYPDGLAGEAIPLGARIIAACDAYDAMTSERPYSVAVVRSRALEEIDSGAGTQFDPRVAAALHRVIECHRVGDGGRPLRVALPGDRPGAL
jgi:diguanylate cyclase (GGDEF)-like protein